MRGLGSRFWVNTLVVGLLAVGGCAGTGGGSGNGNDNGNTNENGNTNDNQNTNDNSGGNTNDNTNNNDNQNDNSNDLQPALYVVNNAGPSVTFYNNAESLDGEFAPDGEVEAGAATSLFQPRSVVVTNTGRLLVSRQNGGVAGYNDATVLNETTTADVVVEGNNTLLEAPISFAYDSVNDRLFVGNVNGMDGILVFDNVSDAGFDGEVAPNRTFGPPDRAPFDNPSMTIDAMHIDANGDLYVSDSMGDNSPNRNRILVFTNAGAATGSVAPARTINSDNWGRHEDIFVDGDDVLYVVDAASVICMFAGASTLDGMQSPSSTIQVNIALTNLQGIVVTRDGTGLVADRENSAIYSFDDIANRFGVLTPDRTLEGFETQLRAPRQLWLVEFPQ